MAHRTETTTHSMLPSRTPSQTGLQNGVDPQAPRGVSRGKRAIASLASEAIPVDGRNKIRQPPPTILAHTEEVQGVGEGVGEASVVLVVVEEVSQQNVRGRVDVQLLAVVSPV